MLISTDCGYNEADLPSKLHNVPLSFKTALTVVGSHFGSLLNSQSLSVHVLEKKKKNKKMFKIPVQFVSLLS